MSSARVILDYRNTMTGNSCNKLLRYLLENDANLPHLNVFRALAKVYKYTVARALNKIEITNLGISIANFSNQYRLAGFPTIHKLHELECHTWDFAKTHKSWGLFSEQSLEAVHKFSNYADADSFGINAGKGLHLFLKRQLFCNFSVDY